MAVISTMLGYVGVHVVSALQLLAPSEIRGRVLSIIHTFAGAVYPLAAGLTGVVADMTNQNIPVIYLTCGGLSACLLIIISLNREFRRFLTYEPEAGDPQ